ncbi:MAG: hypothetical protein ABFD89_19435 [Bryobacteraceae bacterium]
MTPDTSSLIERDDQQLQLIPSSQMDAALFSESESHGEYTAEILFERHRDKYLAAVSFLSEGIGILRIAGLLHISPSSVIAIREREGHAVEIEKGRLSRLARGAARLCVEAIVDLFRDPKRVEEISPRDLGILHGILVDKSELLSGGATARVLHEEAVPGHSELIAYLEALRTRGPMGSGGKSGEQKGEVDGHGETEPGTTPAVIDVTDQVQVGPAEGAAPVAKSDCESDVKGSIDQQTGGERENDVTRDVQDAGNQEGKQAVT